MQWTDRIRQVKIVLSVVATIICAVSLIWSHFLVRDLALEEERNMEVWAEAMRSLNQADESTDLSLVLKVINSNNTIPIVVLSSDGTVQTFRNLRIRHAETEADTLAFVGEKGRRMKADGNHIRVYLDESDYMEICYDESIMIKRMASYPYILLGVALIFAVVALIALTSSKRAEQNKVWVGLSKETAHQLGTPISSLMAWQEVLRETYPQDTLLPEMGKDVQRLQRIAERFSKIGSQPELKTENLNEVVSQAAGYITRRISNRVELKCVLPEQPLIAQVCAPLFEWVIENLCKNAIDAMDGRGKITVTASEEPNRFVIEVADTGKGIPKKDFGTVFAPGYTTKKRGWGLGLSLAKRIVEEYHNGRIFVKNSEVGRGTTFRIELKKR